MSFNMSFLSDAYEQPFFLPKISGSSTQCWIFREKGWYSMLWKHYLNSSQLEFSPQLRCSESWDGCCSFQSRTLSAKTLKQSLRLVENYLPPSPKMSFFLSVLQTSVSSSVCENPRCANVLCYPWLIQVALY